jgi:hypothetical protein
MGLSCAWQSVMCRNDTLPNRGMSYSPSAAVCALASAKRPRPMPATLAALSTCRNSRLERFIYQPLLNYKKQKSPAEPGQGPITC